MDLANAINTQDLDVSTVTESWHSSSFLCPGMQSRSIRLLILY